MLCRWQISSDFLPVLAIAGLLSHVVWFLIVGILFIVAKPSKCDDGTTPGKLLESVLDGTLVIMAISCAMECPIIVFGLRGTPLPALQLSRSRPRLSPQTLGCRWAQTADARRRVTGTYTMTSVYAGTPFEESKRHRIRHVLWARLVLWIIQFFFNCEYSRPGIVPRRLEPFCISCCGVASFHRCHMRLSSWSCASCLAV